MNQVYLVQSRSSVLNLILHGVLIIDGKNGNSALDLTYLVFVNDLA